MITVVRCQGPLRDVIRHQHLDSVDGAFVYEGGKNLVKPGLKTRQRRRVKLIDETGHVHELYMKCYGREPLLGALRRLWRAGRPVSRAKTELDNIDAVTKLGIATMSPVACGADPGLLGRGRSFLLVTAVPGDALERTFEDFLSRHADNRQAVECLTDQLAGLVQRLHRGGLVHRDLYASHVFLDESNGAASLYLIDLARAFKPRWRMVRWRVKDLAQLKYSMPSAWIEAHWGRFLDGYFDAEQIDREAYEQAIDRKVSAMQARAERKVSPVDGKGVR